jgi:dipeptidyl aminopeptidase/acylaminoacyl peptidase
MQKKRDPFWTSPISVEQLSASQISLGELHVDGSRVFWTESRPLEKGRHALMVQEKEEIPSEKFPAMSVQTKVHEYGGGSFCAQRNILVFFDAYTSSLYVENAKGELLCLAKNSDKRWADFCLAPDGKTFVCVCEDHSQEEVKSQIVVWDLQTCHEILVHDKADFYASPRWCPDGKSIAFLFWNAPHMPWDECFLQICSFPEMVEKTCLGSVQECIGEFFWLGLDEIVFASDRNGYSNLYLWTSTGEILLHAMAADCALPLWVLGKRRFAPYQMKGTRGIILAFCEKGIDRLAFLEMSSLHMRVLDLPYTVIRSLEVGFDGVYLIAGSPTMALSLVRLSGDDFVETLLAESSMCLDSLRSFLSKPQEVFVASSLDQQKIYGFFYPPTHPDQVRLSSPPLIVKCHSGPTTHCSPFLQWEIQFWTSRGFAWLDVNYRGSSGYGRKYREALQYKWGIVDVQDCLDLAQSLVEQGRVDGQALFAKGSSSGGFTALGMAGRSSLLKGCISWYGVTDLILLAEDTHRFEKYYLDYLVGSKKEFPLRYQTRSPCHFFEQISCPILFLHGDLDPVVPLCQAKELHRKISSSVLKVFSGEGHGFRRAETLKICIESELDFYANCLDN